MNIDEFEALYKSTKPGFGHMLDRDEVAQKMVPKMIKALKLVKGHIAWTDDFDSASLIPVELRIAMDELEQT